ncbi:hypothetical protein FKM82_007745 [Ascaphus truei]
MPQVSATVHNSPVWHSKMKPHNTTIVNVFSPPPPHPNKLVTPNFFFRPSRPHKFPPPSQILSLQKQNQMGCWVDKTVDVFPAPLYSKQAVGMEM